MIDATQRAAFTPSSPDDAVLQLYTSGTTGNPKGAVLSLVRSLADALAAGRPVLAMESTIFTHGLPRPRNLEVALQAEDQVRAAGVTPATIGVVEGVPTVGMTAEQVERLANDDEVIKASVRELPVARATGANAGTTIAATTYLANAVGIDVFSTGGLGGVHHGASSTFDESVRHVAGRSA